MKSKLKLLLMTVFLLGLIFLFENHHEVSPIETSYVEEQNVVDLHDSYDDEALFYDSVPKEDALEGENINVFIEEEQVEKNSIEEEEHAEGSFKELDEHIEDSTSLIEDVSNEEAEHIKVETPIVSITNLDEIKENQVLLSVSCNTVFHHLDKAKANVLEVIPSNGVILSETLVAFEEGESAFDVLKRELIKRGIHMEFNYTPVYNSIYIEGIQNLYEFDFGELSGWMYKVNGVAPNYASSSYLLEPGDKVEFVYSCDLGKDI